jgi:Pre-rRNA-processing protein TSR2.
MNSTTSTMPGEQVTLETASAEFQAGVTAVLRSWSAFRTAVESGWGGAASKEKAEFLRTHIFECFDYKKSKPSVDVYELEDN